MRLVTFIFFLHFNLTINAQITKLNTGTTITLKHLSSNGNTVLVGGLSENYLAKSYNEGYTLIPLPCPGPSINYFHFQRVDKDTLFMLTNGNINQLYRSVDGGNNWVKRMDTTAFAPEGFVFFNSREGIMDRGYGNMLLRTQNGGGLWTSTTTPLFSFSLFKTYGDSLIIGGGMGSPSAVGTLLLSKDRGCTWPIISGLGGQGGSPTAFCFLNADTIFGISSSDIFGQVHFTKSTNGGQTWQNSSAPLYYSLGLAEKGNDIYVLGAETQDNGGIIAKSSDLGQTWSKFNTGIACRLLNLIFLNDSIALLSGTGGTLLRWNYKTTVFTGLPQNNLDELEIRIFPNPSKSGFYLEPKNNTNLIKVTINDIFGKVVNQLTITNVKIEIDSNTWPAGIYFVTLNDNTTQKTIKVIKE